MKFEKVIKSILYRTYSTIITFIITYLFTGQIFLSIGISFTEVIIKLISYYLYEIIWTKYKRKMKKTLWFTGLSGSGKTTIGNKLVEYFKEKGEEVFLLDGDILRDGLNNDLGFSVEDRLENIRRAAEIAKILNTNGMTVIATFITPTNNIRNLIKSIIPNIKFIYLDCDLNVCEKRDVKGLYKKARNGEINNFTGIDSPFEKMDDAWMNINTDEYSVDEAVEQIIKKLKK